MWNVYRVVIVIATMASGGIACVQSSGASGAPDPVFDVQATVEDESDQCEVLAQVNFPDRALDLSLTATSEAGVHFRDMGAPESGEQEDSMLAKERREFEFACRLNPPAARLSGAYVVRVAAAEGGDVVYEDWTRLYVLRGLDGTPRFLDGRQAFRQQFTGEFIDGGHNASYQVELNGEQEYPTRGLLLMLRSEHDNFAPELTVEVASGLAFTSTPDLHPFIQIEAPDRVRVQFDPVAAKGMRVVSIPFQIRADSRSGAYRMKVTQWAEQATWTEETPFLLELDDHPSVDGQRWVASVGHDQAVILTPEAEQLVADRGGGIGGGGSVDNTGDSATPEPLSQPNPPTRTSSSEFEWNRPFTGYSGDLRDVYERYVRPVTSISWEQFAAEVDQHNPSLAEDGHVFQSDKVYWLPAD